MKSIMEPEGSRTCWICGAAGHVEEHHVFHGTANRKKSEKWGLKVHLCCLHHRDPESGVHGNPELDRQLKEKGQKTFEKLHGHEKFMREFGRNYIDKRETELEEEREEEAEEGAEKEQGQQAVGFWFLEEEEG